ncbi:hypothetical protein NGM36_30920 [Streptomyces mutabilis]|uniref:hypothetical protein n=1 Tax=Streptomyces mutabilis TaxID=67332 RepID=UPI0022BA4D4D|nr:hypothetical protein [Streptomyces mutabilis]MCZ9354121.1 hypothetical protein [Streptomyces mutabilis]
MAKSRLSSSAVKTEVRVFAAMAENHPAICSKVVPYYFYMCDMIPNSEHWRTSVAEAQELQHAIMGYLPGFATPRIVCDVPMVGKRWVHQLSDYDQLRGISYWSKNYRTTLDQGQPEDLTQLREYYDPIYTLPADGQEWWRSHAPGEMSPQSSCSAAQ